MALWRSQSLQVVWFLAGADLSVDTLYQRLFGSEPDRVERSKVPNPTNPFTGIASGSVDGFEVILQQQPGRIDLVLQADPGTQSDEFPPTLETESLLVWLRQKMNSSAQHFPPAIRVAVVCNFLKNASSLDEARAEVASLVGMDERLQSYSDFVFQINRRSAGQQTGIEFNRLLRWATIVFQSVVFNLPSHVSIFTTPVNVEQHASSFMVDLNTVLGNRIFQSDEQISIFMDMLAELERLGSERTPLSLMDTVVQVH